MALMLPDSACSRRDVELFDEAEGAYQNFETDDESVPSAERHRKVLRDTRLSSEPFRGWLRRLIGGTAIVVLVCSTILGLYAVSIKSAHSSDDFLADQSDIYTKHLERRYPITSMIWSSTRSGKGGSSSSSSSSSPSSSKDFSASVKVSSLERGDQRTFPKQGDLLLVHYSATLKSGVVAESTWSTGQPFEFRLQSPEIISGWLEVLPTMSLGQRARLRVPQCLAYGASGSQDHNVPPHSDLTYDLKILAIGEKVWDKLNITTTNGTGDGITFPQTRDIVYVDLDAKVKSTGRPFRMANRHPFPFHFGLGIGQEMPGIELAVRQMSLGQSATVFIPNELAFAMSVRSGIPRHAEVVCNITLLAIQRHDKFCFDDDCEAIPLPGYTAIPTDALYAPVSQSFAGNPPPTSSNAPLPPVTSAPGTSGSRPGKASKAAERSSSRSAASGTGGSISTVDPSPTSKAAASSPVIHHEEVGAEGGVKKMVTLQGDQRNFPKEGDFLLIHYTGRLSNTRTVFDSSRKQKRPFRLQYSSSAPVIKGWLIALRNMSLGERAVVTIPSKLAYGTRGKGRIPANADLEFDMQVLAIGSRSWDRLNKTAVIAEGDGRTYPSLGDTVYVHFNGTIASTGARFESTRSRGPKPYRFSVGMDQVDYGMDFGIQKLSLGERAMLFIPSELAYGQLGVGPIPPNSDLLFDIQLLALQPRRKDCFDEDCPPAPPMGPADVPATALRPKVKPLLSSKATTPSPASPTSTTMTTTSRHKSSFRRTTTQAKASMSHGQGLVTKTQVRPGDGRTFPADGEFVYVHYTGRVASTGHIFDSSRSRSQPFRFQFSPSAPLIKGWIQGLRGMSLGERSVLHIPSSLGYGSKGQGDIPPNADLDFDLELLAIGTTPMSTLNVSSVLQAGDGVHFPALGDTVYIHFNGKLAASGKQFDSTRGRGKPFRFSIGMDQVDYGMDFAIRKLSLGERAVVNVPSALAYGEKGVGPIPPNADLVFDMELLALERRRTDCFDDDCPPPLKAGPAAIPDGALTPKPSTSLG
mmetsp:Transcript_78685/g.163631  ORF Transcript_78685/g.163631 Transcript_78685/m.163631 type:complete len:1034 (+) Transcript_78685:107-3208(+)